MAISNKLVELNNVKQGIKQAIVDKGVDMTDVPFTSYPTKIGEISSGGGSIITTPDYYMEQFENGVAVTVTKTGVLPNNFMALSVGNGFNFLKLTILNGVTSIGNSAFQYWSSNNQPLVIPDGVTSIGQNAFRNWHVNTHPLIIPNSVTSIGDYAFNSWVSNNQPLVIPDGVTSIDNGVFGYWYQNKHPLVIPNSVTSIGSNAFIEWSSNNQPLVIPNSVTSIGSNAFYNWSQVPYIEMKRTTPPTLVAAGAFNGQNNAPIYVPNRAELDYKIATNWSTLASRIKPISSKP